MEQQQQQLQTSISRRAICGEQQLQKVKQSPTDVIKAENVQDLYDALNDIPLMKSDVATLTYRQWFENPNVTFVCEKDGKTDRIKMEFKVGKVEANSCIVLNSGYVFSRPSFRKVKKTITHTVEFVIIPKITVSTANVVPSVIVRDFEDRGLFNITLYVGEDVDYIEKLDVELCMYEASNKKIYTMSNEKRLLYGTKSHIGRYVKKPIVGIRWDCPEYCEETKSVKFPLVNFDESVSFKNSTNQKTGASKTSILFASRKREHGQCTEGGDGATLTGGLFADKFLPPIYTNHYDFESIEPKLQPFRICTLGKRLNYCVVPPTKDDVNSHTIVNGSVAHKFQNYKKIHSWIRDITECIQKMKTGIQMCALIKMNNPEVDVLALLTMYDYGNTLSSGKTEIANKLKLFADAGNDYTKLTNDKQPFSHTIARRINLLEAFIAEIDKFMDDTRHEQRETTTCVADETKEAAGVSTSNESNDMAAAVVSTERDDKRKADEMLNDEDNTDVDNTHENINNNEKKICI